MAKKNCIEKSEVGTQKRTATLEMKGMKRKGTNVWKVIAIVFIILFAVILVAGFVRLSRFRPSHAAASPEQIDVAKGIATDDMSSKGLDPENYTIAVSPFLRRPGPGDSSAGNANVIEVSAYGESDRYSYLIDLSSQTILVLTTTEYYDGVDHRRDADRRSRGFPLR